MKYQDIAAFRQRLPLMIVVAALLLAGCDGDDGQPGPPGAPAGVDIANATEVIATIDRVSIASPAVVDFRLSDGNGNPARNLPASAISFNIAKLLPGTNGDASAWQSYINQLEQPGVGPGTEAKIQATTENGTAGMLVGNEDGSYTYTFALDVANVTEPLAVSYQPELTHRVSFEIRGFAPVDNPVYDFRPADGATTGLITREIVDTDTCNNCHEKLSLHGGARFAAQECVTCHNPGSADANSGNSVDMTVMTHKIHYGANLPSVIAGTDYCIYGFSDFVHCYGDVVHPQDIRNCSNCHDAANPATPNAANWYEVPTAEACGACHDNVDFVTGENHGPGIPANNAECITCHASNPDSAIEVRQAHRILAVEQAANYQYNILAIDFMGPGTTPQVTFAVTNPQNGDARYDLANDPNLLQSSPRFYVAWNTVDYANAGNGTINAQPERTNIYANGVLQATDNGDLSYSLTLTTVPSSATGTGIVTLEGRITTDDGNVPVTTVHRYFGIIDDPSNPVARRTSVDLQQCNTCHELTTQHGNNRNDSIESCQTCHVADAARSGSPSAGPMDIKHFIHRIHAVDDIRYPQRTSNCIACHTNDGFYPVASDSGVLATSINRGNDEADPTDNVRITPNSAVCSVCHAGADAKVHMLQNGASFDACQESDRTIRERVDFCGPDGDKTGVLTIESCGICHGAGRSADVARSHNLDL